MGDNIAEMGTDPRRTAIDGLRAYTLAHRGDEFIHQHLVDADAVQSADASAKPISVALALAGLCLYLEHDFNGRQVQRIHRLLAKQGGPWPTLDLPETRGEVSPADVLAAMPGAARDSALREWCVSVWVGCAPLHEQIRQLLRARGIAPPDRSDREPMS